jgi:sporulation protein YlmC with PRC-barrel domain
VILILTVVPAFSAREPQVEPRSVPEEKSRLWKANALIGMRLENLSGQHLGTLKDFALDMGSGEVRYAIVSSGRRFSLRKEVRAVPPQLISGATAKQRTLAANLTLEQWKNAPTFKLRDLSRLAERKQAGEIEAFYSRTTPDPLLAENRPPAGVAVPLKPTGLSRDGQRKGDELPQLEFASRVIGRDLMNPQREDIGQVSDLLLDLAEPDRVFAIVSTGRFLRRHDTYAVPFQALDRSAGGKKLVMNADQASFGQAPPFTRDAWNDKTPAGTAKVFRYDERSPLNRSTTEDK